MLNKGWESARVLRRAVILRELGRGRRRASSPPLGVASKTVRAIARRYEEGLERRCTRSSVREQGVLDAGQKQRIIAMVCSDPPEGRARWTVRLVAQEAVKRKLVPRVGRETIRILLLQPRPQAVAGKKCGAWPNSMRSTSPRWKTCWRCMSGHMIRNEPVVCLDEKPVTLHADVRPLAGPDRDAKRGATTSTNAAARPTFSAP